MATHIEAPARLGNSGLMPSFRIAASWFLAAFLALLLAACGGRDGDQVRGPLVLAAASLQESLSEAADVWAGRGHPRPVLSFAGSSALSRQIEAGAPGDIFISADEPWMDEVQKRGMTWDGTRRVLLANALVMVAPTDSGQSIDLARPQTVLDTLGTEGRLALADPEAVPAGKYAKAALTSLRIWPLVENRIAAAENVRAALALVERAAAPLGIVYATDAQASDRVRVVARFPAGSHPPIRYPAARLIASRHADAVGFLDFLASPEGQSIFARHGFTRPE